jgi:hypothetical protein
VISTFHLAAYRSVKGAFSLLSELDPLTLALSPNPSVPN